MERTSVMWAVLDASGEVVLLCSGTDAGELVAEWRARGYRIVELSADEVDAA
ncbi:MAG TPA: hypothetical protein VGI06_16045 [Acidimicrobiales bacterium]